MRQSLSDIALIEGNNELNVPMPPVPPVPLAGTLAGGYIWHEGLAAWESLTTGREIPLNEEIHLAPLWLNESEVFIVGHVDLTIIYPDGTEHTLAAVLNQDRGANPESGWAVQFEPFVSSQEGTYTAVATLSSQGQVLDSVTFELISIPEAPPITGGITMALIWHEPLTAWELLTTGREIPLNEEIHLAPGWINKSEVNIVGHVDLTIIYPDGTEHTLAAVLNQDYEAPPQSGYSVQFEPFTSSQEGTYTLVATLSSQGQVLDEVTLELVTIAPATGMITLYGTGFDVKGTDWNWCAYWYYDGAYRANIDDYYGWRGPNDPCTPPDPIDLSNLLFYIQEGSYQYGYTAKYFGPFVVEDGKSYTVNWQTGELTEIGAPFPISFEGITVSDVGPHDTFWEIINTQFTIISDAKYGGYDGVIIGNASIIMNLYLTDLDGNKVLITSVSATPPLRELDPLGPYYFIEGSQAHYIPMLIPTLVKYRGNFPAGSYPYILDMEASVAGELLGTGKREGTLYYPG